MEMENILLSDMTHAQRDKCHMFSAIYRSLFHIPRFVCLIFLSFKLIFENFLLV